MGSSLRDLREVLFAEELYLLRGNFDGEGWENGKRLRIAELRNAVIHQDPGGAGGNHIHLILEEDELSILFVTCL